MVGVYRNPGRWRAVIHQQEIRHSTAGCLLSVVLFAPLFVARHGLVTVVVVALTYGLVVVPALAGYYSLPVLVLRWYRCCCWCCSRLQHHQDHGKTQRYQSSHPKSATTSNDPSSYIFHMLLSVVTLPVSCLAMILRHFSSIIVLLAKCSLELVQLVMLSIRSCPPIAVGVGLEVHRGFLRATGFRIIVNQLVFLLLLEAALAPEVRLQALYHMMGYCVLLYIGHSSMGVPRTMVPTRVSTTTGYLNTTGWFMAARLGKAAVLATLMSVTGHQYMQMNVLYTVVASLYFLVTQCFCQDDGACVKLLRKLHSSPETEEEEEEEEKDEEGNTGEFVVLTALRLLPILASLTVIWLSMAQMIPSLLSKQILNPDYLIHLLASHSSIILNYMQFCFQYIAQFLQCMIVNSSHNVDEMHSKPTQSSNGNTYKTASKNSGFYSRNTRNDDLGDISEYNNCGVLVAWFLFSVVAVYSNVLAPALLIRNGHKNRQDDPQGTLVPFRRATKQECHQQGSCCICLKKLCRRCHVTSCNFTSCGQHMTSCRVTSCGHVYHRWCLLSLLSAGHKRCPLCNTVL